MIFIKIVLVMATNFPEHIPIEDVKIILASYIDVYNHSDDADTWFSTR